MAKAKVNQKERARRAWSILTKRAVKKQEPITYGQLAKHMRIYHRVCGFFLGLIQDYCRDHNLPHLQSLVVNKRTRVPGGGYKATRRDRNSIDQAQRRVCNHPWGQEENPF